MIKKFLLYTLPLMLLLSCQENLKAPAVLWGGEMHNSNASTLESIDASLDLAAKLGWGSLTLRWWITC